MASKTSQPRKRLPAADRRALLLAAASEVVAELGPRRARLIDVAQRAGVAKALLYQHFPSKDALLIALIDQHGRDLLTEFARRQTGGDARAELRDGIAAVLGYAQAHPDAWRILFVERFDAPRVAEAQARVLAAGSAAITQRIRAEFASTPAQPPPWVPAALAELCRSAVDGLIAWWYEHPDIELDQLADLAHRVLWLGIRSLPANSR